MTPSLAVAIGSVVQAALAFTSPALMYVPVSSWVPEAGDRFVADTRANEGFLVHSDGRTIRFPIATGQKKFVCYIGRCYDATTPVGHWVVKTRHIKGDHITFGPSGRFLRLYMDGEDYTAYGIHEYAYENTMFAEGFDRFGSMGCIILKKEMMDRLDETFALNGGTLDVTTIYGVENPALAAFPPTIQMALNEGKR